MKKIVILIMSIVLLFVFCGCKNVKKDTKNTYEQKMTIYSNESQEEKSTSSIAQIENMISVLGEINKLETMNDWIGGCEYKIIIKIDGNELTYMFGGKTFCDSDGKLYKVKNAEQTEEKIESIYNNIGA